ncbi:MAG TPA: phosphoribosylanthranilate isomerase [Gemmatimonadales bacterium]|nr:phosphoribosylanthranilate isomerase [Gemmatimonadales bacterium]
MGVEPGGPVPAKICGVTRPEDAEAAVRLGARWIGVVFAGGPREVTPERAREVVRGAAPVPVIGVFKSLDAGQILHLRDRSGVAGAQLHGGITEQLAATLCREGLEVLAVARLADDRDLARLPELRRLGVPILVEPRVAGALGGTGVALSLDLARRARAALDGHPMFLAGGLTPETVAAAVRAARPDAVDVSSGVEQIPGVKDHTRMARFLEALGWG